MVSRMLLAELLDTVLPQRCIACGRFGAAMHESCIEELPRADGPRCDRCWRPSPTPRCRSCREAPGLLAGVRTPFRFEGDVRRAVLEAKFGGISAVLEPLAAEAAQTLPAGWLSDASAFVPVPLHPRRLRRRGFNQARVVADVLSRSTGLPVLDGLVRRARQTEAQAELPAVRRRENVREAFETAGAGVLPPPAVIAVDDVTTTGATLEAVAGALLMAGVERVYGLALARED